MLPQPAHLLYLYSSSVYITEILELDCYCIAIIIHVPHTSSDKVLIARQPHPKLHFRVCFLGTPLVPGIRIGDREFSCLVNIMMYYLNLPFRPKALILHLLGMMPVDGSKGSPFLGCFLFGKERKKMPHQKLWVLVKRQLAFNDCSM